MMEKAVVFGSGAVRLVGIVTPAAEPQTTAGRPVIIMLNAGLLHRVGPYRLHVHLARELAAIGFTVLRFDLSGIGDSTIRTDRLSEMERSNQDLRDAINFMSNSFQATEFVLFGLCSGAANAHRGALLDARVSGAVFLDGYAYPTSGYRLRRFASHITSAEKWAALPRKLTRSLKHSLANKQRQQTASTIRLKYDFGTPPPRHQVEQEIKSLTKRGVNLLYIYSGGWEGYNHVKQFKEMYQSIDFSDRVQVEYFAQAEHTYPLREDRKKLQRCVCLWIEEKFARLSPTQNLHVEGVKK
ncbi:MAG: alpha/beta fold hydrolase [Gammaproteobacteria bacterium]|nr:alpha/beta fold hydrolase [Gammaproteobacteria bacterium]